MNQVHRPTKYIVHTTLVLDPSHVLGRRGQQWLRRYVKTPSGQVSTSYALVTELHSPAQPSPLQPLLSTYFGGYGVEQFRFDASAVQLLADTSRCRMHGGEVIGRQLRDVVCETMGGVEDNGILGARRLETASLFVQHGGVFEMHGRAEYARLASEVVQIVGQPLADAFLRRSRFLGHWGGRGVAGEPLLVLADAGVGVTR